MERDGQPALHAFAFPIAAPGEAGGPLNPLAPMRLTWPGEHYMRLIVWPAMARPVRATGRAPPG